MAIAYPLTFPTTSGVASISLYALHSVASSTSPFTLTSQVQSYTGQRWGATVSIPPLPRLQAEQWVSFLLKLKGRYGTFLMGDPSAAVPLGTVSGSVTVNGAGQIGDTLNVTTPAGSNVFRAGDYIQLGTGANTRLHKVLNTVNGGSVALDIWPDIRISPTTGSAVTYTNPQGRWRLATNQTSWDINDATFYGITFDCEEAS